MRAYICTTFNLEYANEMSKLKQKVRNGVIFNFLRIYCIYLTPVLKLFGTFIRFAYYVNYIKWRHI